VEDCQLSAADRVGAADDHQRPPGRFQGRRRLIDVACAASGQGGGESRGADPQHLVETGHGVQKPVEVLVQRGRADDQAAVCDQTRQIAGLVRLDQYRLREQRRQVCAGDRVCGVAREVALVHRHAVHVLDAVHRHPSLRGKGRRDDHRSVSRSGLCGPGLGGDVTSKGGVHRLQQHVTAREHRRRVPHTVYGFGLVQQPGAEVDGGHARGVSVGGGQFAEQDPGLVAGSAKQSFAE
jgi:hypothetical protein